MTLQSSGAISLAQVQTEYGGSNPISFNEYLRNGTYVNVYGPIKYVNSGSNRFYWWRRTDLGTEGMYYNSSSQIAATTSSSNWTQFSYNASSVTIGDFIYERSTQQSDYYIGAPIYQWLPHWAVRRKYIGSANNNIPTSASNMGMNDFYGGIGSE